MRKIWVKTNKNYQWQAKIIITGLQQRKPPFSSRPNSQPFLLSPLPGNKQDHGSSREWGFFFSRAGAMCKNLSISFFSAKAGNSQSKYTSTYILQSKVCFLQSIPNSFPKQDVPSIFMKIGRNSQAVPPFWLVEGYQSTSLSELFQICSSVHFNEP